MRGAQHWLCFTPWSGGAEGPRLLLTWAKAGVKTLVWEVKKVFVSWTSLQRASLRRIQPVRWNCHSCLLEMFNELGIQLRKCSTAGSSKIKIIIIVEEGNIFNVLIFLNDITTDNVLILAASRPVRTPVFLSDGERWQEGYREVDDTTEVFCGMQSSGRRQVWKIGPELLPGRCDSTRCLD